jgi:TATA-binding protein-associated factor
MGLGKTLQTICVLVGDMHMRRAAWGTLSLSLSFLSVFPSFGGAHSGWAERDHAADMQPLPSLVVCPSTLVAHWAGEVRRFTDIEALVYAGTPPQRAQYVPLSLCVSLSLTVC